MPSTLASSGTTPSVFELLDAPRTRPWNPAKRPWKLRGKTWLGMILSENRFPLFRIMLRRATNANQGGVKQAAMLGQRKAVIRAGNEVGDVAGRARPHAAGVLAPVGRQRLGAAL
jgi:hypothetical protein